LRAAGVAFALAPLFAVRLAVRPVLLGAPPLAADENVPLSVSWTAPEGCPDADSVRHQVERQVQVSSREAASEPIEARGVVQRNADGTFRLDLETHVGGISGSRTLSGGNCEDLTRAGVLVLGMMIGRTPEASSETAPAIPVASPPKADVAPARTAVTTPPTDNGPRFRWAAGVDALVAVGQLPGIAEGAGLRFAAGIPHWRLELRGSAWLPRQASSAADSGAGGRFDMIDAGGAACGRADLGRGFAADGCAGAAALWLRGRGFGVPGAARSAAFWAAASVGGAVRYRFAAPLAVRLAGEAWAFPFGRPSFALHQLGTVYTTAAVSARLAIGMEFSFGE
jgi:hypothetical protein